MTFHSFCLCTVLFTIKIDQIFDYNVVDQYRRIQLHFAFVHGQSVVVKFCRSGGLSDFRVKYPSEL